MRSGRRCERRQDEQEPPEPGARTYKEHLQNCTRTADKYAKDAEDYRKFMDYCTTLWKDPPKHLPPLQISPPTQISPQVIAQCTDIAQRLQAAGRLKHDLPGFMEFCATTIIPAADSSPSPPSVPVPPARTGPRTPAEEEAVRAYEREVARCIRAGGEVPPKGLLDFMLACATSIPVPDAVFKSPQTVPAAVSEDIIELNSDSLEGVPVPFKTARRMASVHTLAAPILRGHTVRTYSTSLAVPQHIKAALQEQFGADTPIYRQALGVYARVFAEGVKTWCQKVHAFLQCGTRTTTAWNDFLIHPVDNYSDLRVPKEQDWYKQGAYYTLFNSMRGMYTQVGKIAKFSQLLGAFGNQYAVGSYLLTGHFPFAFKRKVAEAWGVTARWVRNTTFGWRRKLENQEVFKNAFPQFCLNKIVNQTEDLKKGLQATLGALLAEELTVLNSLQRDHLLSLLLSDEGKELLLGIVNSALAPFAQQLHATVSKAFSPVARQAFLKEKYPNHMQITAAEFRAAADAIITGVGTTLGKLQASGDALHKRLQALEISTPEYEELKLEVEQEEYRYERLKAFRNHCTLLKDETDKFATLFQVILPASRQLRGFAAIIAALLPKWGGRKRRVLAALGAILSRACLQKYAGEPAKVVATLQPLLTPQVLLTAPFCTARKRRKTLLPLDLVGGFSVVEYPPLYVRETLLPAQLDRHKPEADRRPPKEIVRTVKPALTFVLPAVQVKAAWESLGDLEAPNTSTVAVPKTGTRRPIVPEVLKQDPTFSSYFTEALAMEARLTKTMVRVLQRGAFLSPPRILPPRGPSRKVVANLIFHGLAEVFQPPLNWYEMTYTRKGGVQSAPTVSFAPPRPLEAGRVLGLDRNRISSEAILKFATPEAAVESDAECIQVHLLRSKLTQMRNDPTHKSTRTGKKHPTSQLARVSAAIAAAEKRGAPQLGRLMTERTLLYQRWKNVRGALEDEVTLAGARVLITQGAEVLAAEGLELDPRGARRPLGAIITDLPKKAAIPAAMVEKGAQYHRSVNKWRPPAAQPDRQPLVLETVNVFLSSQLCPDCGGRLKGTKDYDTVYCPHCDKQHNRHTSAARIIAQRGRKKWQIRAQHGLV